ncbi:hypothetical protein N7478_006265 [Penicillium angulare]|uniref:uncharacterized protein n=1 Tax=Penicillium angulare TaxID=116970 RepID=UPI00253FB668|nr:uncharacterized protein N7478_006265 [Penicillium angulare]KAJ5280893.1 hypothetical protein N7478_006265 [Penicillium angulare]
MSPRQIFLMGAPLPDSLDWDHDELLNTPIPPFDNAGINTSHNICLNQPSVKWRVLRSSLPHDVNVPHNFYWGPQGPNFLTSHQLINADSVSSEEDDSVLSQFYDHSFTVHETTEISTSELRGDDLTQANTPVLDNIEASGTPTKDLSQPTHFRIHGPLKDLGDIPTARHLQSIIPQTMTVNLVVGIIAIHPPRRVVTRQWKKEIDVVEMVVGDETRAGFGVNFWLPASTDQAPSAIKAPNTDPLVRSLASLRPQDIVLLRTVGLSSFRSQVYGQSLRGGMTQVDLLHRLTDAGRPYKVISSSGDDDLPQKVHKVREWLFLFVGTDRAGGNLPGMPGTQRGQQLPPDTQ